MPVDLYYDTSDPYALGVVFQQEHGQLRWIFSRELLADGLPGAAGEGDVRLGLSDANLLTMMIELSSPNGAASFEASAFGLAQFVDRTFDLVPAGREAQWLDFDGQLAELMSAAD
ncbi:SsgA family sporulation/cell division regulator [Lentzea sp. E54]|uniref:SsgA family sporulation/cell division regulator n=1 Tax=Lentzea xerophila TaxID=3435883 RepID=UPI003DA1F6BA